MNGLLLLHLLGVVVFVGNIVTAAFWKVRADIGKNPAAIHAATKSVMAADYAFTLPGLLLIIVSGVWMAAREHLPMHGLNWLTASLALFAVTGVIWLAVLIPLQRAMIRHSAESVERGRVTEGYARASRLWAAFGIAATLLPIVILYLMVSKNF
ncbi:DUF2269 family protein [Paenibacillus sp. MWE-103]|uniref:DUF2269 family protein n=1 Tax=Paenibacillus artemisiicola TaxID=1172618 RepID=A0ABS3WDK3_9BACL|nr:DUF2269 family protein [Paenibacillus artemisiicola]MBO7746171.1 DUF2269 family protein [Paenibacillus artemisiicola]